MAEKTSDNPSFVCRSGQLLWGQLHCIIEGYLNDNSTTDTQFQIPAALTGGTILQRNFQYRVKAALGEWLVREIHSRSDLDKRSFHLGYVVYNSVLADPVDIMKRCATVGISNTQDHDDKSIIYVNRYDWSWHHEIPEKAQQLLYADSNEDDKEKIEEMIGRRLIVADAATGLPVINQLRLKYSDLSENELIKETLTVEDQSIGVHLACPDTEYELGWMVFNASNPEELIAFVYDGAYTALDGELYLNDGKTIRSADEWLAILDERKRASEESWANYYADLEAKEVEDIAAIFNNRNSKTAEEVAEELLRGNCDVNLPITSELLNPYRNVQDLQQIIDALEEKKKQLSKQQL